MKVKYIGFSFIMNGYIKNLLLEPKASLKHQIGHKSRILWLELMDGSQELCVGGSWVAVFALIFPLINECATTKELHQFLI